MARLLATANGNLTTAATWAVVDATALLDSEAASTTLTTSYVESASFTPGAITIDGIAVKVSVRNGSTGTMSVRLAQAGSTVSGTEVTINVTDVHAQGANWILCQFASVALAGATAYTVSAKTSSATQVTLFRNATAGNWSRMLRTTTTQAPAAGDDMFICKEWTAAATGTARSVTMDQTAATDYGTGTTGANGRINPALFVGDACTLAYGTSGSTNYVLRLSGWLRRAPGGIFQMPSAGLDRTSTAVLEFDCAADGDFGYHADYGTTTIQGLSRTSAKNVVRCLLTADAAAAGTGPFSVDTDTGWLSGDEVAWESTSRTATQSEKRTLSGNAGASSFSITAGLTNAHSGTSPTQGGVALLTRNVKIRSVSSTAMAAFYCGIGEVADIDWAEFRYFGASTVSPLRGIEAGTATASGGSFNLSYSSIYDCERDAVCLGGSNTMTVDHCVIYNFATAAARSGILLVTANATATLTDNTIMGGVTGNAAALTLTSSAVTESGSRLSGVTGYGVFIDDSQGNVGSFSSTNIHACSLDGLFLSSSTAGGSTWTSADIWRCGNTGIKANNDVADMTFVSCRVWGNANAGVQNNSFRILNWLFKSCTFAGDSSFAQSAGFDIKILAFVLRTRFESCELGSSSGIFVAHSVDVSIGTGTYLDLSFSNCTMTGATEVSGNQSMHAQSLITSAKHDQSAGIHKAWHKYGVLVTETTTFDVTPSLKLTPNDASNKLASDAGDRRSGFPVFVASSETPTVTCWVRKDGSYNGNQPRLVQRANPALGLASDVVLDTMTVGANTNETLSAALTAGTDRGVFMVALEVDGTAGNAFLDTFTVA